MSEVVQGLNDDISHADRVINASYWDKSKQKWWIKYRHYLIKELCNHQLKEFDKSE